MHVGPNDIGCALLHHTCSVERCCHNAAKLNTNQAQEQKAQDEASREESLQRAQAVVSPFTKGTVHRQEGVLQLLLSIYSSAFTPQHLLRSIYSSARYAMEASGNNSST